MKLDDDLTRAMDDATRDLRWDVSTLVDGVVHRGRREVRRARVTRSVGAVAALALAGGVAFAVVPQANDGGEQRYAGTTQLAATVPTTPQAALRLLLDQLPPGTKTTAYDGFDAREGHAGSGWEPSVAASLKIVAGDDRSRVDVGISFEPGVVSTMWSDRCSDRANGGCEVKPLANGARLMLFTDDDPSGAPHRRNAVVDRPDGVQVRLSAYGARPPLTDEQLEAIATSPVWQREVDRALATAAGPLFTPRDPDRPLGPSPE